MNAIRFMSKPAARSFRDLLVWRKAHEFVLAAYKLRANAFLKGIVGAARSEQIGGVKDKYR